MKRFKSFVMVTLLVTTAVVTLSQKANAFDLSPFIHQIIPSAGNSGQDNQAPADDPNNQDPNDPNNQDPANDQSNQDPNDQSNQDPANDQSNQDPNDQSNQAPGNYQNNQAPSHSLRRVHFHHPHHYRRIQRRQTDRHQRHIEQRRGPTPTRPQPHKGRTDKR